MVGGRVGKDPEMLLENRGKPPLQGGESVKGRSGSGGNEPLPPPPPNKDRARLLISGGLEKGAWVGGCLLADGLNLCWVYD